MNENRFLDFVYLAQGTIQGDKHQKYKVIVDAPIGKTLKEDSLNPIAKR
jgi:hypothetical protein